ncbi:hypothetical protein [Actinorugispora endophytica]|uniref:Uncharacterized protein n=1 Tax=Actinorugispora endophytica TaxID=1605990 RepID=A0A4R6VDC7_9ACTN|nr:hypothetical protein [Actinorugispora endophytica]TDQ54997.1 hypothetical protein EV190_101318 [Actinorugispora endophytica]
MTTMSDLAERHRRLYSAAARMMWSQGDPVWRGDRWPEERARTWRALEKALLDVPTGSTPSAGPVDPAFHLASGRAGAGGGIPFDAAVRGWEARLDADPGPSAPVGGGAAVVEAVWQTTVTELLDELAARLAPGRPGCVVTQDAADLAGAVGEMAAALRAPFGDRAEPPVGSAAPLPEGGPEAGRPVAEGDHDRLSQAARAAARAMPSRAEAEREADFSVRVAACDAAADLERIVGGEAAPGWRERYPDVEPDRHLVWGYRWSGGAGRPLSFVERAAELRADLAGRPAPRAAAPDDPVLQDPPPDGSLVAVSRAAALVGAELLDELAARLAPGASTGTIHFTAYPVHLFLKGRFRRALTAG